MQDTRLRSDNTSGVKGVSRHKKSGKWQARIEANGRELWLGYYPTREEAEAVVILARRLLHPFAPPTH